jgi:glycosyltransferase involved in cell wall biosynthesis
MDNNYSLSIVLPVYNEGENIRHLVAGLIANIKNYINDFEIILVNDGSTDESVEIINSLAKQYPVLRIIANSRNKGYGFAIRGGIYNATKKWLLIMDADGQFEIDDLKAFWDKKLSYDFIIGYRKERKDNSYRKLLGKSGNSIANLFLKTNIFIKDINCGFKLFSTMDLKSISLKSSGGAISFEILYKLLQNKHSFTQLPVTHYKRMAGKSTGGKFNTIIKIISEFIKLKPNIRN